MTVAEWLKMAKADAERRGGPELVAALEGLAKATEALRAADWNDDATERRGESSDSPELKGAPEGRSNRLRQGYGESADQPPLKLRRSAEASAKAEADDAQAEDLPQR